MSPSASRGSRLSPSGTDAARLTLAFRSGVMARGSPQRLQLECRGIVQGVGFRPFIHRLARELALSGTACNVAGAVRLELHGLRPDLERFLLRLPRELPAGARLEPLRPRWSSSPPPHSTGPGVRIEAGPPEPLAAGLVAPALAADRAPCPECLAELTSPGDRRHGYPFISCSSCGPRYSIATAEPFTRAGTTMAAFPLCAACRREFGDPSDRRFHAETISCPACGPRLALVDPRGRPWPGGTQDPIGRACSLLRGGGILALQGVGGFQLLVDATDGAAVARLRRRKQRPTKPLALLIAAPDGILPHAGLDATERALLRGPAAPIVLLRRRPRRPGQPEAFPGVAPGSASLGVMLPASPLHVLLVRRFGGPLVATSGNRSGEPLCIDPAEALERLQGIADAFLIHDRPIARPLDDSLLQVVEGRATLLRRARGFAPEALELPASASCCGSEAVLALGGDLKCAPALRRGPRIWLSPHLGDLADGRLHARLEAGVAELWQRRGPRPRLVACDGHPGYLSHQLALRQGHPVVEVSHHLAHGLAVMAEHGLQPPLLTVAFDGLGHGMAGEDPQLWGGEFLWIGREGVRRQASLRPFPLPGGEQAMREPRRCALGLLAGDLSHPGARHSRLAFRASELPLLGRSLRSGGLAPLTSSVGRLFDAVASLLGLCQELGHEGESGMRLEEAALPSRAATASYPLPLRSASAAAALPPGCRPPPLGWLDWGPLLAALLEDVAAGASVSSCAMRFHRALARGVTAVAVQLAAARREPRVVLAGGCFQNRLLLELSLEALRREGLEPLWSQRVPCNDGGLALGQIQAVLWGFGHGRAGSRRGGFLA